MAVDGNVRGATTDAGDRPTPATGDGRTVLRLAVDADALEHHEPGEPLSADAARELAALLDGYAAAVDARD